MMRQTQILNHLHVGKYRGDVMLWLWLLAAVVQGVVVLIAGWLIWRRPERNPVLAAVLIAVGLLIVAANALWLATEEATGGSWMGIRGGMRGLWLSNLTAVELLSLALLALGKPRGKSPRRTAR